MAAPLMRRDARRYYDSLLVKVTAWAQIFPKLVSVWTAPSANSAFAA